MNYLLLSLLVVFFLDVADRVWWLGHGTFRPRTLGMYVADGAANLILLIWIIVMLVRGVCA